MLSFFDVIAQNETNYWYFGENAGINFSNGDVNVLTNGSMATPAGCASISDSNGDLLFYSNGKTIWNKNHQIMVNGDDMEGDIEGVQTSIIIPKPNDDSTYYVFFTREANASTPSILLKGIFYSEVKFTPQNPLGIVTIKNERIANTATARLAAAYHYESNSYRLICLTNSNTPVFGQGGSNDDLVFRVFKITMNGVDTNPILWSINQELVSYGPMKISPDGNFLAVADYTLEKVYFYKFNNETIDFEFHYTLPTVPAFGLFIHPYGIEFSQDSKMFYYTGNNYIIQFPFTTIGGMNPTESYLINCPGVKSLQLARNGKIYASKGDLDDPNNFISVIHKPEKDGVECEFQEDGISLSSGNSTKDLPNFVSTFLRNRIIPSEDACVNTTFSFSLDTYAPIDSVQWDFGDGSFSAELNPNHIFVTSGTKKVKALISTNNRSMILYKNIEVYPLPNLDQNFSLTQCDFNNDGSSIFNLENIKDHVIHSNPDFQYYFYSNLNDANNDENQIQNQHNYISNLSSEEIFVKIISDKGCSIVTSFFIENIQTTIPSVSTIYVCENSDNIEGNLEGTFNLGHKKQDLISELNIPSNFSIQFYATLLDAQTKLNLLDKYYTSPNTIIWIRIEDENFNCFGIIPFNAIVNPEINLNIEDQYAICENNNTPLILDGGNSNDTWQWKKRVGSVLLSSNRFFEITQIGNYSLTVTKLENGIICTQTKNFRVIKSDAPILDKVTTEDGSIFVSVKGIGNYLFSLDGVNYYGDGTNYTFTNLEPGNYEVYVKDIYGCEIILVRDIQIFKFPKFFTPNEDGVNDQWKVYGILNGVYKTVEIQIFDRYGKLLYEMNLSKNQFGWDGIYNKQKLPASDYWYRLKLVDYKGNSILKNGHFSLIR